MTTNSTTKKKRPHANVNDYKKKRQQRELVWPATLFAQIIAAFSVKSFVRFRRLMHISHSYSYRNIFVIWIKYEMDSKWRVEWTSGELWSICICGILCILFLSPINWCAHITIQWTHNLSSIDDWFLPYTVRYGVVCRTSHFMQFKGINLTMMRI